MESKEKKTYDEKPIGVKEDTHKKFKVLSALAGMKLKDYMEQLANQEMKKHLGE